MVGCCFLMSWVRALVLYVVGVDVDDGQLLLQWCLLGGGEQLGDCFVGEQLQCGVVGRGVVGFFGGGGWCWCGSQYELDWELVLQQVGDQVARVGVGGVYVGYDQVEVYFGYLDEALQHGVGLDYQVVRWVWGPMVCWLSRCLQYFVVVMVVVEWQEYVDWEYLVTEQVGFVGQDGVEQGVVQLLGFVICWFLRDGLVQVGEQRVYYCVGGLGDFVGFQVVYGYEVLGMYDAVVGYAAQQRGVIGFGDVLDED